MKVTRFNPSELARSSDFSARFRPPFGGLTPWSQLLGDFPEFFTTAPTQRICADIYENKDHFFALFEVPGVKKEDIQLELNNQLLTLSVQKREVTRDGERTFSMTRSIAVPRSVVGDSISAKLENGILRVTLPKVEDSKPKGIEIA